MRLFRRAIGIIAIVTAVGVGAAAPLEAASATEVHRVLSIARNQRGDPWVYGAEGPHAFDCSGFVYFAFKKANLVKRIGGSRMGVSAYWNWFAQRGRASRHNGRRGDLVVWGRSGKHIGIYLGHGKAISTMMNGVQVHDLHYPTIPFVAFLHVRLERR